MRVTKQLIQQIANENTWMTGEPVTKAKLIDKYFYHEFHSYAMQYDGYDNCLADVQDCILDFFIFNAEIRVKVDKDIHPSGIWQIFGPTIPIALDNLHGEACSSEEEFEGKEFSIRGLEGKFRYIWNDFSSCLEEGRFTIQELLEICRI